jgi:polar amino acid transport system substrate-binding protein
MEVKLNYVEETSWATMIDTLESGRADMVVSGIWPSSTRALRADFSRVVYYSPIFAYARANDSRFDGDLGRINQGQVRIATIDGELSSIVARTDYPAAAAVALPQQTEISQLLLQIASGKADVTFIEPAVAKEYMAKNPGALKRVPGVQPVRIFPNTFLFKKGDTGLRDAVNVALVELTNSGRLAATVRKYDPTGEMFVVPPPPVTP